MLLQSRVVVMQNWAKPDVSRETLAAWQFKLG